MAYWSMVLVLAIGVGLASGLGGVLAGPPMIAERIAIALAALTAIAMIAGHLRLSLPSRPREGLGEGGAT